MYIIPVVIPMKFTVVNPEATLNPQSLALKPKPIAPASLECSKSVQPQMLNCQCDTLVALSHKPPPKSHHALKF